MISPSFAKLLIFAGTTLLVAGLVLYFFPGKLNWFGKLPGDLRFEKENLKIYFPFASLLILTILINLII